jgi:hypothetical protein
MSFVVCLTTQSLSKTVIASNNDRLLKGELENCEISGSHCGEYEDDIALCSLVEVDRLFRGAYCLHHQGLFIFKMFSNVLCYASVCLLLLHFRNFNISVFSSSFLMLCIVLDDILQYSAAFQVAVAMETQSFLLKTLYYVCSDSPFFTVSQSTLPLCRRHTYLAISVQI